MVRGDLETSLVSEKEIPAFAGISRFYFDALLSGTSSGALADLADVD